MPHRSSRTIAHEDDYSDTPAFLRTARQHDHSRYDDVLYDQNSQNAVHPQYADGQYQDGYQDQADPNAYPQFYADGEQEEEQPRRKRGGLMTILAVLVLAFVGTAAAYGYRSFTGSPRSGDPPVIKAEPGANKIVPPTQTSDATGKIVDRIGGNGSGQERVVPREEQPLDINGRNPPRVVFPPPNLNANPPQLAATTQAASPAPQAGASNGALGDEPKRVRTYADPPRSARRRAAGRGCSSVRRRRHGRRHQRPLPQAVRRSRFRHSRGPLRAACRPRQRRLRRLPRRRQRPAVTWCRSPRSEARRMRRPPIARCS